MIREIGQLPAIGYLFSEFKDPQIEMAYRRQEIQYFSRFAVMGLAILMLALVLGLGILLDVSHFTGATRHHLPMIIGYRLLGLVILSVTLWWTSRRLAPNTFYYRMAVFIFLFSAWYVIMAYLYVTLAGATQNRVWFAVIFTATIIGSNSPVRFALLNASPLLVGALVLHLLVLGSDLRTLVNVIALMLGTGALATFVIMRLNRGRRLEYAYRENLQRINEKLQLEVEGRTAAEAELTRHRDHLEDLIRERTREKLLLEAQLFQAQKVEALGRLAGGVAHDFNNLLIPILNYAEMTHDSMKEDDPMRKGVGYITSAAERAADLSRQLLAYSRKQAMQAKVLDLHQLIDGYRGMLASMIREDIQVEITLDAEQHLVKGDESQLGQILINTAVNAADAMPDGGKFSIRTSTIDLDDSFEDPTLTKPLAPGRYLLLEVRDTGKGMDPATREHIFEPFFTTKERSKGTGLGLSMVFGIIKQHGGHINVESEPGSGSLFRIYLPLAQEDITTAGVPARTSDAAGGETVLVVEDEEMVRVLLIRMLEKDGFKVLVAQDGVEAIRLSGEYSDEIQLLLTDLILPRMNGRQVWEEIHKTRPGIRVVFTSGYTDDVLGQYGVLEQGTVFLQKPFTKEILLDKIREALAPAATRS